MNFDTKPLAKAQSHMDFIRRKYNVPAYKYGWVKVNGKAGLIMGARDCRLIIRLEGQKRKGLHHPQEVTYWEDLKDESL